MKVKIRQFLYNRFHPHVRYTWYGRFNYGAWELFGVTLAVHFADNEEQSIYPEFDWEKFNDLAR